MTWTGPRCPHCGRAMNAWGRVCCDCAMGAKTIAAQTENSRTEGRMETTPASAGHTQPGSDQTVLPTTEGSGYA